jgi:hypothetical protein
MVLMRKFGGQSTPIASIIQQQSYQQWDLAIFLFRVEYKHLL